MKGITVYFNYDDAKYYSELLKKSSRLFDGLGECALKNPSGSKEQRVGGGVEFLMGSTFFRSLAKKIDKQLALSNG